MPYKRSSSTQDGYYYRMSSIDAKTETHFSYRVSTITAVGSVNTPIDIDALVQNIDLTTPSTSPSTAKEPKIGHTSTTLVYVEHTMRRSSTCPEDTVVCKGSRYGSCPENISCGLKKKKKTTKSDSSGKKRMFDNQATIILETSTPERPRQPYLVNMKVFRNGHVQLTGAKSLHLAVTALEDFVRILTQLYEHDPLSGIVKEPSLLSAQDFKVCLMNSDTCLPYQVLRSTLYNRLNKQGGIVCSYELCAYPGVRIRFYCDLDTGHCEFSPMSSSTNVSKIVCAVFRSGCILLTGAKNDIQLQSSHAFIRRLMDRHADHIKYVPV